MKNTLVKKIALYMSAMLLLSVSACSDTTTSSTEETESVTTEVGDSQIDVIINNRDMWYISANDEISNVKYAVTDLNNDGNYELIVSATGSLMRSACLNLYEVTSNGSELEFIESWTWTGETDEILEYELCYGINSWVIDDGNYVYAVSNYVDLGKSGFMQYVYHVTFTDSGVTSELIAYKHVANGFTEYYDASGNVVDGNYFDEALFLSGLQKYEDCDSPHIEWIELDGTINNDYLYSRLIESVSEFELNIGVG